MRIYIKKLVYSISFFLFSFPLLASPPGQVKQRGIRHNSNRAHPRRSTQCQKWNHFYMMHRNYWRRRPLRKKKLTTKSPLGQDNSQSSQ